jgi:probable H4MPT-linked C1 transfer pathway protein
VIGLDVGGANLKAAHTNGEASSVPFALWRNPSGLSGALRSLLATLPPASRLAVTMSGELCDCYESKRQGVAAILEAAAAAAPLPVRVWRSDGRFTGPEEARRAPLRVGAANWMALATFAGRLAPQGTALLIDVGSTTTDIVPLNEGKPVPRGRTDPERLQTSELVYKGVRRTPVCCLTDGAYAAEVFATTLDIYLVLGSLPEAPDDRDTADGRPATRAGAHGRLARMLCADLETSNEHERRSLALTANLRMVYLLASAVAHVAGRLPAPPRTILTAGSGEFLARSVLREHSAFPPCPIISLSEKLGPAISTAACAHAVAVLNQEREG